MVEERKVPTAVGRVCLVEGGPKVWAQIEFAQSELLVVRFTPRVVFTRIPGYEEITCESQLVEVEIGPHGSISRILSVREPEGEEVGDEQA